MQHSARLLAVTATLALTATGAHAAVTISSGATANMSCASGVCAPTAKSAVLNVGELEGFLASGNVTVTTTGSGVEADDIHVSAPVTWASSSTLSLEAHRSTAVNAAMSITGQSGLTLDTGRKGTLSFGRKGSVTFANLSSKLTINSSGYTLVGDIKSLAGDIKATPGGNFALANKYDASGDGIYQSSPIPTSFTGTFDGLGNAIANLTIDGATNYGGATYEGLFANVAAGGTLTSVGLVNASIAVPSSFVLGAPLVGLNNGSVAFAFSTGKITVGKKSSGAGLVADNYGTINNCHSGTLVKGPNSRSDTEPPPYFEAGLVAVNESVGAIVNSYATGAVSGGTIAGLVGINYGTISGSYATGSVSAKQYAGGLTALNMGAISNSYATGSVNGGVTSFAGGLVATNSGTISFAYSIGSVTAEQDSFVGGLIGDDNSLPGSITASYWDTDTSGITNLSQGAGNIANDSGITGLTTAQFQSGLPAGFVPSVWTENANINGGLPYLLANPPPK